MTDRARDVARWVCDVLAARGVVVHGIATLRDRPWSSGGALDTDLGRIWFKRTAIRPDHRSLDPEPAVTSIASRASEVVVEAIAVHPMLVVTRDAGPSLADTVPDGARGTEAVLLAALRMQRDLAPHVDDLLVAGLPDLRPARLLPRLDGMLDRAATLPPEHPLAVVPPVRRALLAHRAELEDLAARLAASRVPCSLEHNDLHARNAFGSPDRPRIGDLGDAVVAHPFHSARKPLFDIRRAAGARAADRARDRFLDGYAGDRATLRAELDAAIRLGGIVRAVPWHALVAMLPYDAPDARGQWDRFAPWCSPLLREVGAPLETLAEA